MQTSLREKVGEALGWERSFQEYHRVTLPDGTVTRDKFPTWRDPRGIPHVRLPEPEDIAVVWRLRELAIEKGAKFYSAALAKTMFDRPAPENKGQAFRKAAEASKEEIRTAALSVLHGVSVGEVRTWV